GAVDADFGVADGGIRARYAQTFHGSEDLFVEIERLRGALDKEIGCDRAVAVGNGFDLLWHARGLRRRRPFAKPFLPNHFLALSHQRPVRRGSARTGRASPSTWELPSRGSFA